MLQKLNLTLRLFNGDDAQPSYIQESWNPARTGVIICDMWDRHWCISATDRVAEMAPRMNKLLHALRNEGCTIAHAPSDTMDFYKDTPQRIRTLRLAEGVELNTDPENQLLLEKEPKMSVNRDGSECDCDIKCTRYSAWSRQIDTLDIEDGDLIGDNLELLRALKQLGITHIIMLGVHTNMCVVGRAFGIRNQLRYGFRSVLVRDMTDCRAPKDEAPFFNHYTALDYVIRHIERHLCPTVTSDQILGDEAAFRFRDDKRETMPDMDQIEREAQKLNKNE